MLGGSQQALAQSDTGQVEAAAADGAAPTGAYAKPEGVSPFPGGEGIIQPRRGWSVVPGIRVGEIFTDNVAPATGVKRSDQITEISPSIRIDSDSERLKLHLKYQLRQFLYAQASGHNNTQNHLNAFGTLDAVDNWLFLDVSGVVAQQEISPFRVPSASSASIDPNRVETSTFRASPYIRGRLAGAAEYEVRYNRTATRSSSAFVADVDSEEWTGVIKAAAPQEKLGWGVDATHRNIEYHGGRNSEEDRIRGLLTYRFDPEFRVSVSAGQEDNNFGSATKQSHDIYGYGFDWLPSQRTLVSAFREKRFFGNSHNVSINYRTPLTVVRFSDTRDISVLPNRFTTAGFGTIHDLLFAQMASSIPDPVARARQVDSLLQDFGLSPDLVVIRGFFTSRVSVLRRQELSYALLGKRSVLTLAAARTEHEAVGPAAGANDIFTLSSNIRQQGISVNLTHRLTPLSSVSATASQHRSSGSGLETELRSLYVNFSSRLGPNTTASLGVRRALFDSETSSSYSENALIGALTVQF